MVLFEKKVIIGSVTSFIITAVGLVAVFFPSMFNFEKKKIKEVAVKVYDSKSVKESADFLHDLESGDIFKLTTIYGLYITGRYKKMNFTKILEQKKILNI